MPPRTTLNSANRRVAQNVDLSGVIQCKIVAIGDGAVGKTSLLRTYADNSFEESYQPTVFDNYACCVMANFDGTERIVKLGLWDTAGQHTYDRLRPLSYPGTDCFVLCYSVISPSSLENVEHAWIPEVRQYCPEIPIVLVGTKTDARDDPNIVRVLEEKGYHALTYLQGQAMQQKHNLAAFVECSAKSQFNIKTVFDTAILSAFTVPDHIKKKKCTIL